MARTDYKSVDQYIAAQPNDTQAVLRRVDRIIRKAVLGAVDVISYQIPAYRIPEGTFLFLGGWKGHYSLYPASDAMVEAFGGALERYRVSKGTLRFPLAEPVPVRLIERIAKFRAREVASRAKAKQARGGRRS